MTAENRSNLKNGLKNWFKKWLDQYNQLCRDLGVDNGSCRGCVPVVKFDPEPETPISQKQNNGKEHNDKEQKR